MPDRDTPHTLDFDASGFERSDDFDASALGAWVLVTQSDSVYILLVRPDETRLLRRPRHLQRWLDDVTGEEIRLDGRWNAVTETVSVTVGERAVFWIVTRDPVREPSKLTTTPVQELRFRPIPTPT